MSEIRNIITDTLQDREVTFGDDCVALRTSTYFKAEIEPVADMELNVTLGRDPRESVIFHIRDRVVSATLNLNDLVTALGNTFRILRRSDNPISTQVDFGAMKITNKDSI